MAYILLVIHLLCSFVVVKSQNEVMCHNATGCEGDFEMIKMEHCCDNRNALSGLSYRNTTTMECNDCPWIFGFFETTYSDKERGEAHSVLVGTISGPTPISVNVTVTLNRITADEVDIVLFTTNLTLSAGQDPLPVSFMFINDSISQEVNERFSLTLTLAEEIEGYGLHLVLNGTIIDDDIVVFKLSQKEYREDESNATMLVKITKEQNVWLANPVSFRISPLTIDDAISRSLNIPVERRNLEINIDSPVQANAEDFNTTTFTVDFPADEGLNILTDVAAYIAVVDDEINENGEQIFIVLLEVVNATDISLVDNTQRNLSICKIIDNDPVVIGFKQREYTFNEPDEVTLKQLTLVKEDNRKSEQTYRVAIITESSTSPGFVTFQADVKAPNLSLLFLSTSEQIHYTFSLQPDQSPEGVEVFCAISSSEGSITYRIPDARSRVYLFTSVRIQDNDVGDVEVGFERTQHFVNESSTFMSLCVKIMNHSLLFDLRARLDLLIRLTPGSADMDDFDNKDIYELRFGPDYFFSNLSSYLGDTRCTSIDIINDDTVENTESFTSSISVHSKRQIGSVFISPNVTVINILDDDDAVIGFINAPYTVNEFDRVATMTIGVLKGSSIQIDVHISVKLFNGSAIAFSDFMNDLSNNGMITLNASNPTMNVPFSLVDDSIIEQLENLYASLNFSGTADPHVSLDPSPAEVIILGDEDRVVGFVNAPYTVNEYDHKVTLTVEVLTDRKAIGRGIIFGIFLREATAKATFDYLVDLSNSGLIILSRRNPIQNISFSIVDDLANEPREHFSVSLAIFTSTLHQITLAPASADIIILGDEVSAVGFKKREYVVDEGNSKLTMEVGFLTDGEVFAISLNISLIAETANVSSDYLDDLSNGGFIVLNARNPAVNISFSLVDDSVVERLETLSAKLTFSDDADQCVVLGRASALIYIQDNDDIAIGFDETEYSVNESAGILEVCSGITNLQDGIHIVVLITAKITVQAVTGSADDNDFMEPPFNSTTLNLDRAEINNLRICLNITIIEDEILEDIESFTLEIFAPPNSGIIARPNVTVISILDDDVATIGFFDATYSFGENDSTAFLQFGVLSGGLQINVSVQFNISQESTLVLMEDEGGELYILNADQPSISISFNVVNDNIYERTKFVVASLSFIGDQPARLTIAPDSAHIYILDDEVLDFRFDPDMYSVSEDDANITLSLHLVSGNLGDIGVILRASISKTAIFHEVTFEGKDTLELVELPILSDAMGGRPMDFEVELSFIKYTKGQAMTSQDKERIHLGGSAQVTIRPPLPISAIIGTILGSVAFIILGAIIYLIFALVRVWRRKRKLSANQTLKDNNRSSFKESDEAAELKTYTVQSSFKLNISKQLMINSCNLEMSETVGQGQYGIVYRGKLSKGFTKGFREVVAVKTLKGFLDKSLVRCLLEECYRMSTFDHPNVLTLIGVCMDGGPAPYIVMPFMFNGSLISYLRNVRDELYFPINSDMDEKIMQASCKLIGFCLQIAKGMEYLASKMIIHRDLAARNCMIDLHFVVKVSDFGLSESINPSKDYFRQQEKGVKLPFKWMAPESLGDGIFSEKTDVWSYGVTCWEVFSSGKSPHAGMNATDLCPMLESGYRMDKPNNAACSDIMYSEVVQKCWELKPENRPNFSELVPLISLLLEANAGYTTFCNCTIQDQITATTDAGPMESTAVDSEDNNTIHCMETTAIDKEIKYVTTKF